MHEVFIEISGGELTRHKFRYLPCRGDMLSIRVDGVPTLLRVVQVWHREGIDGDDSTPVIDCVEIAEVATDEHQ